MWIKIVPQQTTISKQTKMEATIQIVQQSYEIPISFAKPKSKNHYI